MTILHHRESQRRSFDSPSSSKEDDEFCFQHAQLFHNFKIYICVCHVWSIEILHPTPMPDCLVSATLTPYFQPLWLRCALHADVLYLQEAGVCRWCCCCGGGGGRRLQNLTPLFMPLTTLAHGKKLRNAVYHPGNTITYPHPRYVWVNDLPFPVWWDMCDRSLDGPVPLFSHVVVIGASIFGHRQGKGVAITKAKLKNLLTGAIIEKTLSCLHQIWKPKPWIGWRAFADRNKLWNIVHLTLKYSSRNCRIHISYRVILANVFLFMAEAYSL